MRPFLCIIIVVLTKTMFGKGFIKKGVSFTEPRGNRGQDDPFRIRSRKEIVVPPPVFIDSINPQRPAYQQIFLTDESFLRRLYGEWSLWHSTSPSFRSPNNVMVYLYPSFRVEIVARRMIGPFLYEERQSGKYMLTGVPECSIEHDNDAGSQHADAMSAVCTNRVRVEFFTRERRMLSVFGIGLDNAPIHTTLHVPEETQHISMDLHIIGHDDLFLSSLSSSYHLIRSIRPNEPSINVPFSTLVATQITGMYIAYLVHQIMCWMPHAM